MTNINEVFTEIQKSLDKELIGQNEFIKDLCSYFNYKFEKNEKGILVLIGEKETAKKTSIRRIVEYLKANYLVENSQIDEIDLGSYNFNLGYNAFLTDLYEKLSLDSACVMFTNIEKASDDILKILPNLYPNTYLNLNDEYI
nr:stage V sporulation protein K [Paeniclostridium ghonii]